MNGTSSFYWAMRLLVRPRRRAMFALYGYCRMLDDIADSTADIDIRRARLAVVRGAVAAWFETGIALDPHIAALAPFIRRHDLPRTELEALIDGMGMDVDGPLVAPSWEVLQLYCRRVAGSVGMLAIRIFDRPDATTLAIALGEALQLTNILRDLSEDARMKRLYLPSEALNAANMVAHSPQAVLTHPALPLACAWVADRAEASFSVVEQELAQRGRTRLTAAAIMMATYRRLLARMRRDNWRHLERPPRLSPLSKLAIALRVMVTGT